MRHGGFAETGRPWRGIRARVAGARGAAAAGLVLATLALGAGPAAAQPQAGTAARLDAPPGTISTVAGGVGGPARASSVSLGQWPFTPCGLAPAGGSVYVATYNSVRKVNQHSDWLTTVAGAADGKGDGVPAISSALDRACAVAVDHAGNVVLAEYGSVRLIATRTGTFYGQAMTAGDIYTVAGEGTRGLGVSGVPATQTKLWDAMGVAVDARGNLVIADSGFSASRHSAGAEIRVVAASSGTFYHRKMVAGDIYTVAGSRKGTGYGGDGGPAGQGQLGTQIGEVRVDSAGNLVIADTGDNAVRVVAVRTGTFYGHAMTSGDIYTVAGDGTAGYSGDGGPATSAELNAPASVAVDGAGNVVIADSNNYRVRVAAGTTGTFYGLPMTAGSIYTVAGDGTFGYSGDGGPATGAELKNPQSVAVDGAGNLLIADSYTARVRAVAIQAGSFYGRPMTAGDIYTVAGNGQVTSGDRGPALAAELGPTAGTATDSGGNTFVADGGTEPLTGRVQMLPASSGTFFGQAMTAGNVYTVAGTGKTGFTGDGGPATSAELSGPAGVAVDAAGNLVISDWGNNRIRVVAAASGTFYGKAMTTGDIYTVAGGGSSLASGIPATSALVYGPAGLTVDGSGNLVIASNSLCEVQVVAGKSGTFYDQAMTAGDIYRVAGGGGCGSYSGDGGPATSAGLEALTGVAVDSHGNLVIDDTQNYRIRVVAANTGTFYGKAMTAGDIYTVAGDGTEGYSGDGGKATAAEINPNAFNDVCGGLAVDAAGNLVLADTFNSVVRVVAEKTGTFYGVSMTAGDIYTVAGNGMEGFTGDGGPATSAELIFPAFVTVTAAGTLLITDLDTDRVRAVTGGPAA
jgi:hypothetical protein